MIGLEKYEWTKHAHHKMRYYGLSEQRVKRVIRMPFRYEEGILEKAIAVMQPASVTKTTAGKPKEWKQEIWAMYVLKNLEIKNQKSKLSNFFPVEKKIKIITAWRYPGMSPKRDPIPSDVLAEIRRLL